MNILNQIFFSFNQVFYALISLWFISIPLLFLLLISIYKIKRGELHLPRQRVVYLAALGVPIIIAILGGLFRDTQNILGYILIWSFTITYLFKFLMILIHGKGYRMFVVSLGGLLFLMTLIFAAVAHMSISNVWL